MKILMVCLGNICRSPLAEGILKSKLSENFVVESAGTINMHEGNRPDPRSIAVAKNHDLDIANQKSKHLKSEDLDNYDLIFCMDQTNLKDVQKLATDHKQLEKIKLIIPNSEVPDPYYGGDDGFEKVYQMLDEACDKVAQTLLKQ